MSIDCIKKIIEENKNILLLKWGIDAEHVCTNAIPFGCIFRLSKQFCITYLSLRFESPISLSIYVHFPDRLLETFEEENKEFECYFRGKDTKRTTVIDFKSIWDFSKYFPIILRIL